MRLKTIIIAVLPILIGGCSSCGKEDRSAATQYQSVDSLPMLVMQIQSCSRLYTTEYRIHKIVTHDDVLRFQGSLLGKEVDIPLPLGNRSVAIPMDATLKAYIDFAQFSSRQVETSGRKITILLPDPKVEITGTQINHKETKEYVSLFRAHFSDQELASYEKQGRQAIVESIPTLGIIDQAKVSAANILIPMLTKMGYRQEDITITFRKEYGIKDIERLIE